MASGSSLGRSPSCPSCRARRRATITIYYKLYGDENGTIKKSFEITGGKCYPDEEYLSTRSKATKVHVKIIEVEVDE